MNLAEKIYVVIDREVSYNLCSGGKGGFGYINDNPELIEKRDLKIHKIKGRKATDNILEKRYGKNWRSILSKSNSLNVSKKIKEKIKKDPVFREKMLKGNKIRNIKSLEESAKLKRKETFKKIEHQQKQKNSQYGTCWMTNGKENIKIKKEEVDHFFLLGYYKGRIVKIKS